MKKVNNSDIVVIFLVILAIIIFLDNDVYNDMVQNPFNSPSPRASGRLFYLLLYKIDQVLGKLGIISFFSLIGIFHLYRIIKALIKK